MRKFAPSLETNETSNVLPFEIGLRRDLLAWKRGRCSLDGKSCIEKPVLENLIKRGVVKEMLDTKKGV